MRPVVLGAKLLKVVLKESTHGDDAVSHLLDLTEPLLVKGRAVEDLGGDASTVNGRVGVQRSDDNLELRVDALLLIGIGADHGEGTDTLAVETHVLGKGLAQSNVVALLNEVADSESILVGVTASKTLVGHVEEGKVLLLLDDIGDLLPLLLGGIYTSRVVGAGVEKEDTAVRGSLDVSNHTLEVETDSLLVVVAVLLDLKTGVVEDSLVVSPRRLRDVDLLLAREELGEESSSDTKSTGTRDGLGDGDAVQGGAVGAVGQLGSGGRELGDTGDASVLLIHLRLNDLLLGLAHGGENVRLASIVTVGTDTQVDLLVELVGLEGFGDTKNSL
jgi:hypothetical protein